MAGPTIELELTADNEELIQAMLADAGNAPEPGDLKVQDIIHRGDGELPAPQVAQALESAGYVYIYNRRSGERSVTNRNMLPAQLKKKFDDGTKVYTLRKPDFEPVRGAYRCSLHPDERKPEYDAMGLPVCPKANLTSPFQVRLHMQRRHPTAWQTLEDLRKDRERADELEFRRAMIESATGRRKAT